MSRLSGDLQGNPSRTYPSRPDPLQTPPPRPDLDLILTQIGRFQVQIRSKSGPNQVCAEVFGGGRGERGRSGWDGPGGPPESLETSETKSKWVTSCCKHDARQQHDERGPMSRGTKRDKLNGTNGA